MNGAILPLVGGELAKAAFQNGQEKYAVDILNRLDKIMEINNRKLPGCINHNGTEQEEAVPNEWGQAAFVSALVEGLAGVVDKGIQFHSVEISPRWYFAGVNETSVNVGYGNDGEHVIYQYNFNPKTKKLILTTEGKFKNYTARFPFPEGIKSASGIVNGKKTTIETDNVNGSKYAVIKGKGSKNTIEIQFH